MRHFRLPALAAAIALTLAACAGPTREVIPVEEDVLLGQDWRLVATPDDGSLPTQGAGAAMLRFSPSRFSMTGPCNNHTGAWTRSGDQLVLGGEGGAIVSTKRGCPGELMARESALLAAMQQPLTLAFADTRLALVAADGSRWTFDSQDVPTSAGRERIVLVSGQRKPCTGVAAAQCLQVRTEPGAPWQHYYGDIEGFSWQEGVDYVLRIREYTVANPPADGSSRRWVLEEILDRSRP
ncbi:MAG TPA: META and DUF4377 domain-containing protein, partial [Arenimonas sp.]|nr:META and DUF4377 domain-containing protein [Arenimonas sp.]